jgi:hypothetical protein
LAKERSDFPWLKLNMGNKKNGAMHKRHNSFFSAVTIANFGAVQQI